MQIVRGVPASTLARQCQAAKAIQRFWKRASSISRVAKNSRAATPIDLQGAPSSPHSETEPCHLKATQALSATMHSALMTRRFELLPSVGAWRHDATSVAHAATDGLYCKREDSKPTEQRKVQINTAGIESEAIVQVRRVQSLRVDAVEKLLDAAFGREQSYWLAKFIGSSAGPVGSSAGRV